ncbi:hypothetical protein IRJ41_018604 [Triplophysa rosa]|uniref:Uncharacterized protein n=1 Tax=Triplophysa rosa TaxID=992332 RepID=A0A9W7X2V4_TRIRA|nr:hypothetical protein IRJ41_018604 [Triplophysa rosa]
MHGTSYAGLNPSLHESCSPVWALANHVVPCDAVDAPNRIPNPPDDASNAQAFCSRTAGYAVVRGRFDESLVNCELVGEAAGLSCKSPSLSSTCSLCACVPEDLRYTDEK